MNVEKCFLFIGGNKSSSKTATPVASTEDDARTHIRVSDLAQYLSGISTPSGERTDQVIYIF